MLSTFQEDPERREIIEAASNLGFLVDRLIDSFNGTRIHESDMVSCPRRAGNHVLPSGIRLQLPTELKTIRYATFTVNFHRAAVVIAPGRIDETPKRFSDLYLRQHDGDSFDDYTRVDYRDAEVGTQLYRPQWGITFRSKDAPMWKTATKNALERLVGRMMSGLPNGEDELKVPYQMGPAFQFSDKILYLTLSNEGGRHDFLLKTERIVANRNKCCFRTL